MTVVIDVGCAARAGEESVHKLIERFHPRLLIGYDPGARDAEYTWHGTDVMIFAAAAWTRSGSVKFVEQGNDGIESFVAVSGDFKGRTNWVPCTDLAVLLRQHDKVVLKMDVEGAEYELIPHLIETGAIERVRLLLIEWHGDPLPVPVPTEPW